MTKPETTFAYAVVEQALMAVHRFVEQRRGAFRARLVHFQRLKIVPASPGKGRRIAYRREYIYRWAVALEFAEFGIDPSEIKKILDMRLAPHCAARPRGERRPRRVPLFPSEFAWKAISRGRAGDSRQAGCAL